MITLIQPLTFGDLLEAVKKLEERFEPERKLRVKIKGGMRVGALEFKEDPSGDLLMELKSFH